MRPLLISFKILFFVGPMILSDLSEASKTSWKCFITEKPDISKSLSGEENAQAGAAER